MTSNNTARGGTAQPSGQSAEALRRIEPGCKPLGPNGGVTGRDRYLIVQALAYAIECIEHLPLRWQEYSNQQDMIELLDAVTSMRQAHHLRVGARAHITRRGTVFVNGELALAPIATQAD